MNCMEDKLLILLTKTTVTESDIAKVTDLITRELDWSIWLEQVIKRLVWVNEC